MPTLSAIDLLVICTGNICRSPMAEGLLRQRLVELGVDASVHSAGLVTVDRPASDHGVEVMARRGIDISAHRSRIVVPELVAPADLVLTMELHHLREVAVMSPDALAKTFTLPMLVRSIRNHGPRRPDETVSEWARRLGADRRPADLLGSRPDDEVADPIGLSLREYEQTASEIEAMVDAVVRGLCPSRLPGESCA